MTFNPEKLEAMEQAIIAIIDATTEDERLKVLAAIRVTAIIIARNTAGEKTEQGILLANHAIETYVKLEQMAQNLETAQQAATAH